jgi:hypothetical protein
MIKVKQDRRTTRLVRRGNAIGMASQHETRQFALSFLRLHDLLVGGAFLREF